MEISTEIFFYRLLQRLRKEYINMNKSSFENITDGLCVQNSLLSDHLP